MTEREVTWGGEKREGEREKRERQRETHRE